MSTLPLSDPQHIIQQALLNIEKGNLKAAENMSTLLMELHPKDTNVLLLAAEMHFQQEDGLHSGLSLITKAIQISPPAAGIAHLATRLINHRKLNAAEQLLRLSLSLHVTTYNILNLLGAILREQKKHLEAITYLKKAIKISPQIDRAWLNLGVTYMLLQQYEESLNSFTKAVEINTSAYSLHLQAAAHINLGNNKEAKTILERALLYSPDNPNIIIDICAVYYNMQDYDNALSTITNSLDKNPNNIELLKTKGVILRQMGRVYDSIAIFDAVLKQTPNDIKTIIFMANAYYYALGDNKTAKSYYERAYALNPENPEVIEKLCTFLQETREGIVGVNITNAYNLACKLIAITPNPFNIAGAVQPSILAAMDYDTHDKLGPSSKIIKTLTGAYQMGRMKTMEDRLNFVEVHRKWGVNSEEAASKRPIIRRVTQRFNNKIRIGILSSDLRHHPVGYFVWPIIEHLDRNKFEIYCYSAFPHEPDMIQKEFMARSDSFKLYLKESIQEVAQSIADDGLDILFELGGKTLFNRLEACSHKPAPVQASWLGYPHSIGLPTAIDYIVVDPYINPDDPRLLIEKPLILPETWVSLDNKVGFAHIPITNTIPEDINGYITFGTLNAAHKFNPDVFALWAQIMHMVPNSRFLYARLEADAQILRDNFCKHMAKHGINKDRLSFIATNEHHLNLYNKIDIALDTFPHTGGTTTCETLWMGVPAVTLVGPSTFERLSYSNLSNAGLGDLCAFSLEEYKTIALQLAGDKERRRYLRRNLRQQLANNPLGQPKRFADNMGESIMKVLNR